MSTYAIAPSTLPARISHTTFSGIVWGGTVVSLLFVIFRAYVRIRSFQRFFLDDAFVLAAWMMILATAIIWQCIGDRMYQTIAVTSGQLFPPPATFVPDTESYLRASVAVIALFYSSLWAVKLSFLVFFRRLNENVRGQRIQWWCVFGFTLATYFTCIGTIEYNCLVPSFLEIARHCSGHSSVRFQRITLIFNCAMDVLTDTMITSIPITMLWRVRISVRQKLALSGIFSLVLITMVFALVRVTVISSLTRQPEQSWLYMWSAIEQSVALIIVCLASFRALFIRQDARARIPGHKEEVRRPIVSQLKNSRLMGLRNLTGQSTTLIQSTKSGSHSTDSNEVVAPINSVHVKHHIGISPSPSLESGHGKSGWHDGYYSQCRR